MKDNATLTHELKRPLKVIKGHEDSVSNLQRIHIAYHRQQLTTIVSEELTVSRNLKAKKLRLRSIYITKTLPKGRVLIIQKIKDNDSIKLRKYRREKGKEIIYVRPFCILIKLGCSTRLSDINSTQASNIKSPNKKPLQNEFSIKSSKKMEN